MPVLKNARHEKLAQYIAKGMSATEAYEKAGYKRNDGSEVIKEKTKQRVRS